MCRGCSHWESLAQRKTHPPPPAMANGITRPLRKHGFGTEAANEYPHHTYPSKQASTPTTTPNDCSTIATTERDIFLATLCIREFRCAIRYEAGNHVQR